MGLADGRRHAVVIGGGMLGAAVAEGLSAAGRDVVLLEAAPSLGGLASAWTIDTPAGPVTCDRFYHVVLGQDRRVVDLLGRLGLGDALHFTTVRSELLADGAVHPMSSVLDLLRLPVLDPVSRVRVGGTVALGAVLPVAGGDGLTSAAWLRRWSGRRATRALWLPLLRAKLGESADLASARFIRSTFRRLLVARLRGGDGDRFGWVEGGYAAVLGRLADRLATGGVDVRTGVAATGLEQVEGGWRVSTADGVLDADEVVLTTPGPVAARLAADAPAAFRAALDRVPYLGCVCVTVVLRRAVTGGYLTYVTDETPYTAVVEMSNLNASMAGAGTHVVYLPRYCAPDDPAFAQDDETIANRCVADLLRRYPHVQPDDVLATRVARARHVMPVPVPGWGERRPPVRSGAPGLYLASSAQVTDGTLNVETTLALAESALQEITGMSSTGKPTASVSLDADNLWSYLKTHGDPAWEARPGYLPALGPRLLEAFDRHGVTGTVFVVGHDAATDEGADFVGKLAAAGHEIGNHSFEHEPWLHLYSRDRLDDELARTEAAIVAAGAPRPVGFRGPGFSLSPELLELLEARGYTYDATTLPTWIGPLARAYYFRSARLSAQEREQRRALFGSAKEVRRPIAPYRWSTGKRPAGQGLVELPVTTMPLLRVPIHVSYVLHLHQVNPRLAKAYVAFAMQLCRRTGIGPSILLHPLDLLDRADAPGLEFFPGMALPAAQKAAVLDHVLDRLTRDFDVVGTGEHARRVAVGPLRERSAAGAGISATR